MSLVPVSREKHKDKAITPRKNYSFASETMAVPVSYVELPHAVSTLPMFFLRNEQTIELCALLGLEKGKNLFISPNGDWITDFIPAAVNCHPFAMGSVNEQTKALLVKEDSKAIVDRAKGEPLFNEDGSEGRVIRLYAQLLNQIMESRKMQQNACLLLEELSLLQTFDGKLRKWDGSFIKLEGLLTIDWEAFRKLGNAKFSKLKKFSAMDLVYAHRYSLNGLKFLLNIWQSREKAGSNLKGLGANIFNDQENEFDFNF